MVKKSYTGKETYKIDSTLFLGKFRQFEHREPTKSTKFDLIKSTKSKGSLCNIAKEKYQQNCACIYMINLIYYESEIFDGFTKINFECTCTSVR